jgi:hypothetical protein
LLFGNRDGAKKTEKGFTSISGLDENEILALLLLLAKESKVDRCTTGKVG